MKSKFCWLFHSLVISIFSLFKIKSGKLLDLKRTNKLSLFSEKNKKLNQLFYKSYLYLSYYILKEFVGKKNLVFKIVQY